jgi:Txe/YoeB family toxin of Txe-Axe toxin-antitoxin module
MSTCVLHDRFIDAASELPKEKARKVWRAIKQFRRDPHHPGLNYEKLTGKSDRYWSIRVDQDYRIVLADTGELKILMFVGSHQDAYRFAKSPVAASTVLYAMGGVLGAMALVGGVFRFHNSSAKVAEAPTGSGVDPADCSHPLSERLADILEGYPDALALLRVLRSTTVNRRTFSCKEIKAMLRDTLPISARMSLKWWNSDVRIAAACELAGWRVSNLLRLRAEAVFERVSA